MRGTDEAVFEVNLVNMHDAGRVFVARNCTQIEQGYEIYSLQGDQLDQDTETVPNAAPDQPLGQILVIELDPLLAHQRPKGRRRASFLSG